MTKIIWMTDPHFQSRGTIDGLDPRARLAAAIDHANLHHGDADMAVISGDLVGDDVAADYLVIAQYLGRFKMPVYPLMGNNDSRYPFREHLPLPDDAMPDFIQYAVEMNSGILLGLDTHMTGSHAGELCAARTGWLAAQLAKYSGKPVYIFMHHPPLALHLPPQDEIMLQDGAGLVSLLKQHRNVQYLFLGHVHRPTSGVVAGIPFSTLGALSFQAPAPRPDLNWDRFQPHQEAPHYAVVHIDNGTVVIQHTHFCDYALGVTS